MVSTIYGKVALIITVLCLSAFIDVTQASICTGVKEGDWIEYQVTTTGSPPQQFDVTWARMEILNVKETQITTNVTTKAPNGTLSSRFMILNLEKGQVGAWFIIPANLNQGDFFLDQGRGCKVIVEGEEQLTYAGIKRAITNATTTERIKQWDKATGVFVLCIDTLDNYTINATAIRTNMWDTQRQEANPTIVMITLITSAIIIASAVVVVAGRKKFHARNAFTKK